MTEFEIYADHVIYTDGDKGAVLNPTDGLWTPLCFFDSGDYQELEGEIFRTPIQAYKRAEEYFT